MGDESIACPACQAELGNQRICWLCRHVLTDAEVEQQRNPYTHPLATAIAAESGPAEPLVSIENPYLPPPPVGDSRVSGPIEWILIGGLILVLIFLIAAAPGLGILVAIVTTPALVRTAVVVSRKQRHGAVVSVGEKSVVFFASMAAVVTASVAAGAAFAITCVATCFGLLFLESAAPRSSISQQAFPVLLGLAGLIGLVSGGLTLYALWRRKDARAS